MPGVRRPFDGTSRASFLPLVPDELDRVLEKEAVERFIERQRHETTTHIRPMHPSPPSRMDADWQPPSQDPPGFTQPDPRTTPVIRCIETRRSTVTMSTRAGSAIPNWKRPEPRLKDRDAEVARLAFVQGLGQAEIATEIARQGYSPVTPDRIGQVLNAHSGRDRIIRFLALAPEGLTFTSKEIAIALSIDIARVQYVLDGLQKKNIVSFKDVRNGPDSSDHKTKIDIHLNRRARGSRIVMSVMNREPLSPPTLVPFADQAAADARFHEAEVVYTAKPSEVVTNVGPDQQPDAFDIAREHVKRVAANAALLQQEVNDLAALTVTSSDEFTLATPDNQPMVKLPWIKGSMGGWPAFRDIRERALKATKINAAAKLLEEAGEDEIALTLMDKTFFGTLEEEVVKLLQHFGEIE